MPARANLRSENKARTRARILRAARRCFDDAGYDASTIRDIARAAEVSLGSVHAHFRDKRALLRACLYEDIATAVEGVWDSLDADAPLVDQLLHCADGLYRSYARKPELSRVMLSQTLFPADGDEPDELIGPFLGRVAALFERAESRGEIVLTDGDAARLAGVYFSLYLTTLVGGLGGAFGAARSAAARAALWRDHLAPQLTLVLDGLRKSPRRSR